MDELCTVFGINTTTQCTNEAVEEIFPDDIEDINNAWLEPGWVLRRAHHGARTCRMHLEMMGEI